MSIVNLSIFDSGSQRCLNVFPERVRWSLQKDKDGEEEERFRDTLSSQRKRQKIIGRATDSGPGWRVLQTTCQIRHRRESVWYV